MMYEDARPKCPGRLATLPAGVKQFPVTDAARAPMWCFINPVHPQDAY